MKAKKIDRRDALKTVFTSAGIAGSAAMVPDSWLKPAISIASIPAHASTSGDCDFDVELTSIESTELEVNIAFSPPPDIINSEFSVEFLSESGASVLGPLGGNIENGVVTEFEGDYDLIFEQGGNSATELDINIGFESSDSTCSFSTQVDMSNSDV